MSVVKLDLRISSQSPQQQYQQQQQQSSPSAPLVKINLSPESTRLSENGSCSSSLCSCCPTSNNHSMQVANLITNIGSASSISARISPQHTLNKQQQQQQHDDLLSISPTYPHSQSQHHHLNMNIEDDVLSSIRNKLDKAPRKVSSTTSGEQTIHTVNQIAPGNNTNNSTTNLENIVETLSKKLEKSSLENTELKDTLLKEKSRSQMMLSENLSIKEELKKAYLRLKELESLQNMRSSQQSQAAIHSQRSSWVRSSPVKKPLGFNPPQKPSSGLRRPSTSTHQQNNQKQLQQLQQQQQQFDLSLNNNHNNNNNLLHNDEDIFRDQHEGCSLPDDCYCQQQLLEQNQSSQSILDILQNLNGKHDRETEYNKDSNNFHEDHGNGSFSGTISKLKTQNSNGLKMMTAVTSQSGRRTNRTPLQQQQGGHGSSYGMTKKAFS